MADATILPFPQAPARPVRERLAEMRTGFRAELARPDLDIERRSTLDRIMPILDELIGGHANG